MLDIVLSNQFKKDITRLSRRGLNIDLLDEVVDMLANRIELDKKYRDHALNGTYAGFRECHIKPDWLLVYRIDNDELYLLLSRTGTHSDLFG